MTAIFAQNGSFVHPGHLGLFFNLLSFTYHLFSSQLLNVIQEPTEVNQNTCRPPLTCVVFGNKYLLTKKHVLLITERFCSNSYQFDQFPLVRSQIFNTNFHQNYNSCAILISLVHFVQSILWKYYGAQCKKFICHP